MGAPYQLSLVEEEDATLLFAEKDGIRIILFKFMSDGSISLYCEDVNSEERRNILADMFGADNFSRSQITSNLLLVYHPTILLKHYHHRR